MGVGWGGLCVQLYLARTTNSVPIREKSIFWGYSHREMFTRLYVYNKSTHEIWCDIELMRSEPNYAEDNDTGEDGSEGVGQADDE